MTKKIVQYFYLYRKVQFVEKVLMTLRALSDPTRFAVFQCIRCCGDAAGYDVETGACDAGAENGMAVCDVRCQVPCAPSTLTHHLNTLREAGLIETEKRGRMVYAWICPDALVELTAFFTPKTR